MYGLIGSDFVSDIFQNPILFRCSARLLRDHFGEPVLRSIRENSSWNVVDEASRSAGISTELLCSLKALSVSTASGWSSHSVRFSKAQ